MRCDAVMAFIQTTCKPRATTIQGPHTCSWALTASHATPAAFCPTCAPAPAGDIAPFTQATPATVAAALPPPPAPPTANAAVAAAPAAATTSPPWPPPPRALAAAAAPTMIPVPTPEPWEGGAAVVAVRAESDLPPPLLAPVLRPGTWSVMSAGGNTRRGRFMVWCDSEVTGFKG